MALTDKLTAIADAIRAKTGKTDSLTLDQMPTENANITGGGGSSADVRYVTFTNPATGETFVKPVVVGDDCVDVVAKGLWAKPTQESTAQYDYAFANSWSATPNGSADANILKNITEDKTVYAVFTATTRTYTITWLDEDGTELPGQKQWEYGKTPSYTPVKEGATFANWTPAPVAVTGDATYTAVWASELIIANQKVTTSHPTNSPIGCYGMASKKVSNYNAINMDKTYTVVWASNTYTLTPKTIAFERIGWTDGDPYLVQNIIGNPYYITKQNGKDIGERRVGSSSGEIAADTGEYFALKIDTYGVYVYTKNPVSNVTFKLIENP